MTTKQVIVIRKDLNMSLSKQIEQSSNSSFKVFSDKFLDVDEYWNKNPANKLPHFKKLFFKVFDKPKIKFKKFIEI